MTDPEECSIAPEGWRCTRDGGHDGPCAAEPDRAYAPHCDSSILHAPGECQHCDTYPDWQQARETQRINFTGHMESGKSPCPSVWFRDPLTRDLWGGNQAQP